MSQQAAADEVRQHLISSLFSKRDENGTNEETLISYVKVFEDESTGDNAMGGQKTRYLMLAVTKLGKVVVHKGKRNNNMTFSKGKTWEMEHLKAVEVVSVSMQSCFIGPQPYSYTPSRQSLPSR
jgi:hypothetical protein